MLNFPNPKAIQNHINHWEKVLKTATDKKLQTVAKEVLEGYKEILEKSIDRTLAI